MNSSPKASINLPTRTIVSTIYVQPKAYDQLHVIAFCQPVLVCCFISYFLHGYTFRKHKRSDHQILLLQTNPKKMEADGIRHDEAG